jgi:hypothetical protein
MDDFIVTAYVVVGETMAALAHRNHPLAVLSDAEVLTVAVVTAKHFQRHHALARAAMRHQG